MTAKTDKTDKTEENATLKTADTAHRFDFEDQSGPRKHRLMLWLTALTLIVFFAWAANAPLEEVTRGQGKVIPLSRGQLIQSLEGGIVSSINVREGAEVNAGDILAVMDDKDFNSEYRDLESQTLALKASLARLTAELAGDDKVNFPPELNDNPQITEIEETLFQARRRNFTEATESLTDRISISQKQADLANAMIKKQAMSVIDGLKIDQELANLKGSLSETNNKYYQEISDKISQQSAELESLLQKLNQKQDALARTDLRSPVRGIVKNLNITTPGAVIRPGEAIMEIVPLDDQLFVEAEIKPRDVAFLHVGQPANVKITAYDYTVYGMLKGELVFISADTLSDEQRRDEQPYYRVRVLTDIAHLTGPDGELPIKPGMVAQVDILTGSKTVLDYLMKPILRGREAMTEQ